MKISPLIKPVAAELEAWALAEKGGWTTVATAIADLYHRHVGGNLLPRADTEKGLDNAIQRVKRIFREDGPIRRVQATELVPVALAAMPVERRRLIESPGDPVLLAAKAGKETIEAINAVILGAAPATALKEINEALSVLNRMKEAVSQQQAGILWRHSRTCSST